jgi:hypothetical protein
MPSIMIVLKTPLFLCWLVMDFYLLIMHLFWTCMVGMTWVEINSTATMINTWPFANDGLI